MTVYQYLNGADWRNIWVVGDLHGCYSLLQSKLAAVNFNKDEDLLISVGDLADRGKENVACLSLISEPWFRVIRGNHEEMMLDALVNHRDAGLWRMNGGEWFFTLDDADKTRVQRLLPQVAALPLIIEVEMPLGRYVICHADYPAEHYQRDQPVDEERVVWSRERIAASQRGHRKAISGADAFVFGHTPVAVPLHFTNQFYIDTGAVFSGTLTLMPIQGSEAQN
ncbi:metallophosphoesterase [Superficieibacter sp. 1612_C1]|uniref:metallophosphoesterase n=1 Tax=Superficieibacter sp. 1612_C1 TaxID=2780382 RepID=UPI0018837408|nr:metallophosphoesterase [Superficieibacter sp. 1612_C1]